MKNNNSRVVITGLGAVAPNAIGLKAFQRVLEEGRSGIRHFSALEELNFRCTVGGQPEISEDLLQEKFTALEQKRLTASGVLYGALAGLEAWQDAGLNIPADSETEPRWEWGCLFGAGLTGIDVLRESIYKTDDGKVRKLGTTAVEQTMPSGISAWLGGKLGLGNLVSSNASACSTGTESILMAAERIRNGQAQLMLAGSCDAGGPYVWGGFDSMRVLTYRHNHEPEKASRPMAADASGFVPGCGAGAMVLESLESALGRGARIYGEVLGGFSNSGGQRGKGSMTAPNPLGVQKCIEGALANAGISGNEVDLLCGHLTSTMGDPLEVENWSIALGRSGSDFPLINSLKSLTGHCLSAAGSVESVAAVLQLHHGFVQGNRNCETVHPDILSVIDDSCIPRTAMQRENLIIAKSSFGFGDVNSCIIFKHYTA